LHEKRGCRHRSTPLYHAHVRVDVRLLRHKGINKAPFQVGADEWMYRNQDKATRRREKAMEV